jgi:hypothetical protein
MRSTFSFIDSDGLNLALANSSLGLVRPSPLIGLDCDPDELMPYQPTGQYIWHQPSIAFDEPTSWTTTKIGEDDTETLFTLVHLWDERGLGRIPENLPWSVSFSGFERNNLEISPPILTFFAEIKNSASY